jgi:monooxygenase
MTTTEHVDVLIIGAGLSGIGMACHLRQHCPNKTFAIVERRRNIGGTWDLFRYPGVRSDSDMFTYAYSFRPWPGGEVLLEGASIRDYIEDTAQQYEVDQHIRFERKVLGAHWRSQQGLWTVQVLHEPSGQTQQYTCRFLVSCTGYFNYEQGYVPPFKGLEHFQGQVVHPQAWPEGLSVQGKRVVVIGSGATAISLVPALAAKAAHVTMLQRSPTYVASIPSTDAWVGWLRCFLSEASAYKVLRFRNAAMQRLLVICSKKYPALVKRFLLHAVKKRLDPAFDMKHFTPHYNPWDQRLCVVPDDDLFNVIRRGRASVETEHIASFVADGIRLENGQTLKADVVVTATGLSLQAMGGMQLQVDDRPIDLGQTLTYKSVMLGGLPNFGVVFGYTNATWTLKAELAARYLCRVLNHMDQGGYAQVVPDANGVENSQRPLFDLEAGYMKRAAAHFPKQGPQAPWTVKHSYWHDKRVLLSEPLEDGVLVFSTECVYSSGASSEFA